MEQVINEKKNRIILYGAGGYLRDREEKIFSLEDTVIAGITDSNENIYGSVFHGISIRALKDYSPGDYDYIVITSLYADDIIKSLGEDDNYRDKLIRYDEYAAQLNRNKTRFYPAVGNKEQDVLPGILTISVDLSFNGAAIAAVNMLRVLKERGYRTAIASYDGDERFISFVNDMGIDVWICPYLLYEDHDRLEWIGNYSIVMANDYVVHNYIERSGFNGKILWWLHEADSIYEAEIKLWGKKEKKIWDKVNVYCVSDGANNSFHKFYPEVETGILEYGIPCAEEQGSIVTAGNKKDILTLGLIGFVGSRKGQDILLDSVELLNDRSDECRFLIVGKIFEDGYCRDIRKRAEGLKNVVFLGEKDQEEIAEIYQKLDVVISTSRMDPLPIVVTEGMMYGKLCIIPDSIGTNKYIVPDRDAMVYETENAMQLAACIRKVLDNKMLLKEYGERARKCYQNYFSMDAFEERIKRAFIETYGIEI